MAAVVVQSVTGVTGAGGTTTGLVINFSAATAGNILIVACGTDNQVLLSSPPVTGYTNARHFSLSHDSCVCYTVAAGSETSVTITSPQNPGTAAAIAGVVLEVSGLTNPVVLEETIGNEGATGDAGAVNNWPTSYGETSTPADDSFHVFMINANHVASDWTSATADNSFIVRANCINAPAATGDAVLFVEADGTHAATNWTETITGNASPASGTPGAIIVGFKIAAAGGGGPPLVQTATRVGSW